MDLFRLSFSKTQSCVLCFTKHRRTVYPNICQIRLELLSYSYNLCQMFLTELNHCHKSVRNQMNHVFCVLRRTSGTLNLQDHCKNRSQKTKKNFQSLLENTLDWNILFFILNLLKMNYTICGSWTFNRSVSLNGIWSGMLFKLNLDPYSYRFCMS